jgi:uncharacterized membrane protein YqiK
MITAKPSEYLVHVRRGQVTEKSGQGASCFKWPWESVALVPTSLQKLRFSADQVTTEKVGVAVTAMAVYRIADPRLAFRVLNFSFPERAQEKLDQALGALLVGATRRIMATLSVEECLQKRKSALAEQLLADLAPVVGGTGSPDDRTDRGWGVVIDAIEIEEVRVQSAAVFAAMQAPFRAELEQKASLSKLAAQRDVETRRTESDRALGENRTDCEQSLARTKLRASAALAAEKLELERADAEARTRARIEAVERAQREAEAESAERIAAHERARREAEAESEERVAAHERARREAEAELAVHRTRLEALKARLELERAAAEASADRRRLDAEIMRTEGLATAEVELQRAEASVRSASAQAQVLTAQQLPALAAAVGQRIGEMKIAHYGGDGQPFMPLVGAVESLIDLARHATSAREK